MVIHLAALVGEPACKVSPRLTREINYEATISLANHAKEAGVKRFIFASTCSNYGLSSSDELANEESPLKPLSLYAETKIAVEKALLRLNDSDFNVCIVRLATVFGLSPKMRFNLLINEIVRDAWNSRPIQLYNEEAWRPYTHIDDAARMFAALLEAKKEKISGEIFNFGTGNYKKKEIIRLVKKYIPSITVRNHGGMPDNRDYKVSFEKIKNVLKISPKKNIIDGIEEMVQAMKDGIFMDPYDEKYTIWIKESLFKTYE